MLTQEFDPIELGILTVTMSAPERRMQRRAIRDLLYFKYEKETGYSKDTFEVTLQRKLNKLCNLGFLRKDNVGHQKVFYRIQKRRQREISEYLDKQQANRLFDEIWNKLTPQQQTELTRSLRENLQTQREKFSEFLFKILSQQQGFLDFLVESKEGEEFWIWLPDIHHPEKIIKFKKVATKILRQD